MSASVDGEGQKVKLCCVGSVAADFRKVLMVNQ
jgi:hypothetical protein